MTDKTHEQKSAYRTVIVEGENRAGRPLNHMDRLSRGNRSR